MKFENKYLYLANPRKSISYVRNWQLEVMKKYKINIVNPFFEGMYESKIMQEKYKKGIELEPFEHYLIKVNDIDLIKKSCGIIAVVDGNTSHGTIMEMVYATLYNKPVYLICTNGYCNNTWLFTHSTFQFKTFKEFEMYIEEIIKIQ